MAWACEGGMRATAASLSQRAEQRWAILLGRGVFLGEESVERQKYLSTQSEQSPWLNIASECAEM